MQKILLLICGLLLAACVCLTASASEVEPSTCPSTLNFTKRTLDGEKLVNLCEVYLGKVVLVVNTASKCGYTYQYEGLEALYRSYKDKGLVVLGFPTNDFGGQEPGTENQIKTFCRLTYGVEFPMFEKSHAAKSQADDLYKVLGDLAGEYPAWNFHKYILDRKGNLVASFNSKVEPQSQSILQAIEKLL